MTLKQIAMELATNSKGNDSRYQYQWQQILMAMATNNNGNDSRYVAMAMTANSNGRVSFI